MSKSKELLETIRDDIREQDDKVYTDMGNDMLTRSPLKSKIKVDKFLSYGGSKGLYAEFKNKEDGKTYILSLKEK